MTYLQIFQIVVELEQRSVYKGIQFLQKRRKFVSFSKFLALVFQIDEKIINKLKVSIKAFKKYPHVLNR